ncbi:hypothetical protein VTN31DRAFT_1197 [Thermomyces dupontii]|uniref:uncharacterized protein n=1 Tax=Talaromyces thermophilus TaxID=28565 RepID=UPI003743B740
MVPPNLRFLVDDIESDWAYESNPFDFIHTRYLWFSFKDVGKLVIDQSNLAAGLNSWTGTPTPSLRIAASTIPDSTGITTTRSMAHLK